MTSSQQGAISAAALADAFARQRAGQEYGALAKLIKAEWAARRAAAIAGGARGDVAARRLARTMAGLIGKLYELASEAAPDAARQTAVFAVGGFGEGRLAPYSDVDLLFLHKFADAERLRGLLDPVLYALWDAGVAVGHSVHTPASAIVFAKSDVIGRTAFLTARPLAGDGDVAADFHRRFDRLRRVTMRPFVAAKLAESRERHQRTAESRFLAEPNVKDGKGGLRDLQTIRWLHRYVWGADPDVQAVGAYAFDPVEVKTLLAAERFLWSVRVHLHDLHGAAAETLSFDVQPAVAERLGYADRPGAHAVERLMKHYFLNAADVGRLTRLFSARLDDVEALRRRKKSTVLPAALLKDEAAGAPNIALVNGRLHFARLEEATPQDLFRYFRALSKRGDLEAHPDALTYIRQHAASVTGPVRRDPVNSRLFIRAVMTAKSPVRLLRVMGETGFLAKALVFFGKIAGRVEYGLYRRYSLDEQVFQMVGELSDALRENAFSGFPLAERVVADAEDIEPFYVALLVQPMRASRQFGETADLERAASRTARRFCADAGAAADVAWVAARPNAMIAVAERRNLSSDETIRGFARALGSMRRLNLLFILSVCYLRVVNDAAWDAWAQRQLQALYEGARAYLDGDARGLAQWTAARSKAGRAAAARRLAGWSPADKRVYLDQTPDDVARSVDPAQLARFAILRRSADRRGAEAAVNVTPAGETIDVMVSAPDRPGLLADLAGVVAETGLSVRTVHAFTSDGGRALDFMTLQAPGEAAGLAAVGTDPESVAALHAALLKVARAPGDGAPRIKSRLGDRRSIFSVPSVVRVDVDTETDHTIVEAEGRDRPGLLYLLCDALADIGVQIRSAHVATYGERAVDAFYLQDAPGYKITHRRRLQSIERRLLNVLGSDDAANGLS
ncbi:MAG: [protein-PII] uridylyltransferase [Pseudomonadota bacterium]